MYSRRQFARLAYMPLALPLARLAAQIGPSTAATIRGVKSMFDSSVAATRANLDYMRKVLDA